MMSILFILGATIGTPSLGASRLIAVVLFVQCLSATAQSDIERRLDRIFQPETTWSVSIAEADTGRIVYQHRETEPRMPASNMKVYVTAAAFEHLGSRYRYRTPLMGRGQLDNQGVWHGDLLVRGSGDPTFSGRFENDSKNITARLDSWAERLHSHGFRQVTGGLYGHDDVFDEDYWGRGWPDDAWCDWYTAPSGGLILNDSCIDVGIYPTKPGSPPVIKKFPDTDFIRITNAAVTRPGKSGSLVSLLRPFESNDFKLSGKVFSGAGGSQHTVSVTDPTGFFIHVFREVLEKHGVRIEQGAFDADQVAELPRTGWQVLAWAESPPLVEIAQVVNTRSQNLFADSLLKTLGYRKAGSGSWAGGNQVVRDFVASLGIATEHLHLQDGSGLSRLNRITSRDTVELLLKIRTKPWFHDWKSTLAVSGGSEGSLRKRMRSQLLQGKVFAKTGFIDDVYCLTGMVESKNNKVYMFSLLYNGTQHGGKHPHHRMEEALTILASEEP